MKIGIAGIGRMGAAIATRLLSFGHAVMVWNRNPEKAQALAAAGRVPDFERLEAHLRETLAAVAVLFDEIVI